MKKVLIIGASKKPERYSYMAMQRLEEAKHPILLFNPGLHEIEGREVIQDLSTIQETIDTVTLYVGPKNLETLINPILKLKPRRIIANPGTENPDLAQKAKLAGIEYIEACTLMMLSYNQF